MKGRILVVDDDPSILEVIQIVLEEQGYEVILDDGKSVIEKVKKHSPELILLDILLSGFDGRDIATRLKKNKDTKNIPLIVISADLHVEKKAEQAHADFFIKKPFNINELEDVVQIFIDRGRQLKSLLVKLNHDEDDTHR